MAATVTIDPGVAPRSVYRPIEFELQRTDPAFTDLVAIYVADGTLALALGNDVEVGDVLFQYTGAIDGSVPAAVGQTVLTNGNCGPYSNEVYRITNLFTDGPNNYLVVDAPELGTFDPAPTDSAFRIWLDEYVWLGRLLVYTDPASAPKTVAIGPFFPDEEGKWRIDVSTAVQRFFSSRIDQFMDGPVSGITTNAHGVTALFYRLWFVESFNDTDGEPPSNAFDGTHDILVDDEEDVETYRVGVNAIHPFTGGLIDWSSADMELFVTGGSNFSRRFLTHAPRNEGYQHITLKMSSTDRFPVFMLTPLLTDYTLPDFVLKVFDITSGSPVLVSEITMGLVDTTTAAFAVGVGPADLAGSITVPSKYRAYISNPGDVALSEYVEVEVVNKCSESDRRFAWFNRLGGVDQFTFQLRETVQEESEYSTVQKPYSSGTGFDWNERTHAVNTRAVYQLSSRPVHKDVRRWVVSQMRGSANVICSADGRTVQVNLVPGSILADTTGQSYKPITFEYTRGVDNLSQRS